MTIHRRDLGIAIIAAFILALFAIPTGNNVAAGVLFLLEDYTGLFVIPLTFIASNFPLSVFVLTILGFLLLDILSKRLPILLQAAKFIIVGGLNTFLDFAVFNLFITSSGIAAGLGLSFFKGISFLVAVTNSYFWNKYWTFESGTKKNLEFVQFVVISTIGLFINVGALSLIVNSIGAPAAVSPVFWANIGALIATAASLIWNFLGYKFIVFRK